jgi:uncharacterized protein (TIGR02147 family)
MPDIFLYTDYRKYLQDYYDEQKKAFPAFSNQSLAIKANFPSRGFLFNVITGKKNLSKSSTVRLGQAIHLKNSEADYFENLVSFTQAKLHREKGYFFDKLNAIKSTHKGNGHTRQLRTSQYDFYSNWHNSVIRSLLDMHDFKDDWKKLAKALYPAIKPKEAKKAVQLLTRLGIIEKQKTGNYKLTDKTITTGQEIINLGLLNFQLQTTDLAVKAIQDLPRQKRHVSGLTLGISSHTYDVICREIDDFQSKLLALAEMDEQADNVYQFNFHFFPVSNMNNIIK